MAEYSVVGKRLPRIDAPEKATGEARFASDITLPNMLYGKILRSPYPHAKILNIDVSRAKRVTGVKAIITGEDTKVKYGVLETVPETMNEYPLKSDKVRYPGDEIAAVAAIDEDVAQEALEQINVDYEILPAVFDPEAAMQEGAPRIHVDSEKNISVRIAWDFGEVDKAFSEASYVREDRFLTSLVLHAPMEPHTAVAKFDISGKLTLWCSTQVPYYVQRNLMRTLGIDESKIRVIKPHVGGGFGGKWEPLTDSICAALLSVKTGRPVKLVFSREEEFIGTHRRHPEILYLKTGVSKEGKLLARESRVILDGGAYNSCGHVTTYLSGGCQSIPYMIPNYRYEGIRVFTNKAPCGAMRGHGGVQPQYSADIQLDIIAEEMGIDPLDIRRINSLMPGDITPVKYKIVSSGFRECLEKGAYTSDYKEKQKRLLGKGKGVGIGTSAFVSGAIGKLHTSGEAYSSAQIRLHEDGSATLLTGASDIGQGSNTALAMMAAEELGIGLNDIKIIYSDTGITPVDMGSYSSRVTLFAGNAVRSAATELKKKLLEIAAEKLEANIDDIETKNGRIYVKGSPEKGFPFKEIVSLAQRSQKGKPLMATGSYTPEGVDMLSDSVNIFHGPVSPTFSFSAHFTEVEVDKETGKVKILNFVPTHDCGFQINPLSAEGQLEGSAIMGSGYALTEELLLDNGIPLNPSFLGYGIFTAMDIPENISSVAVETIDPKGPFGAKECGEGSLNASPGAIANAVYNAIRVRIKELPITPEKILRAIEGKKID